MSLSAEELLRRFLLHVLPKGFMRIRHFGFLANACRRRRLGQIRTAIEAKEAETNDPTRTEEAHRSGPVPSAAADACAWLARSPREPDPTVTEADSLDVGLSARSAAGQAAMRSVATLVLNAEIDEKR